MKTMRVKLFYHKLLNPEEILKIISQPLSYMKLDLGKITACYILKIINDNILVMINLD